MSKSREEREGEKKQEVYKEQKYGTKHKSEEAAY